MRATLDSDDAHRGTTGFAKCAWLFRKGNKVGVGRRNHDHEDGGCLRVDLWPLTSRKSRQSKKEMRTLY